MCNAACPAALRQGRHTSASACPQQVHTPRSRRWPRRIPRPPPDGIRSSRPESLPNLRKHLMARHGSHVSRSQRLQAPLGDSRPISIDFGVRRIEGAKKRVDNERALFNRQRFGITYDFNCAWHNHLILNLIIPGCSALPIPMAEGKAGLKGGGAWAGLSKRNARTGSLASHPAPLRRLQRAFAGGNPFFSRIEPTGHAQGAGYAFEHRLVSVMHVVVV